MTVSPLMAVVKRHLALVAALALLSVVLASPASADIGPIPCSPVGCDAGCFVLGPGSNEYNSCMAGCESGATSDESLINSAETAFLNDVHGSPYPNDKLLRWGYKTCALLSQGQDRDDIAATLSRDTGQSISDSRYFVTRAIVRLCPVM